MEGKILIKTMEMLYVIVKSENPQLHREARFEIFPEKRPPFRDNDPRFLKIPNIYKPFLNNILRLTLYNYTTASEKFRLLPLTSR